MTKLSAVELAAIREIHLLLSEHTAELGNYTLRVNDHKTGYQSLREYIQNYIECDQITEDELEDVDIAGDTLYTLYWYKDTPVGNYTIYTSSFSTMLQRIIEIIEKDKNPLLSDEEIKFRTDEVMRKGVLAYAVADGPVDSNEMKELVSKNITVIIGNKKLLSPAETARFLRKLFHKKEPTDKAQT